VVHTGQEVEVMVLDVDEERRRISLGLKQCQANPWKEFAENYNKGDKVAGQIKSITDFGISSAAGQHRRAGAPVGYLLDLRAKRRCATTRRPAARGHVLSIDPERERISLGIKQLAKDPFSAYIADNPKGTIVKGVVKEVDARGAVIDLGNGVEGQLRRPSRPRSRGGCPRGPQGGRRARGEVHRRGPQIAHHLAVDQGEGGSRGGRGGAELPFETAPSGGTTLGDLLKEQSDRRALSA